MAVGVTAATLLAAGTDYTHSESFEEYELPFSVSALRILYHSRSAAGEDVAASGVIYPWW